MSAGEGLLRGPGGATQNLPGGLMAAAGRDYLAARGMRCEAMRAVVERSMRLFGSAGKA